MAQEQRTGSFTYAVSKGNYPNHLIKSLGKRGNWTQVSEEECNDENGPPVSFYWRQVNMGFSGYNKLDVRLKKHEVPFIFNHFEVIRGITTKTNLVKSLKSYYEENQAAKAANY
jgi:hypothetical protein